MSRDGGDLGEKLRLSKLAEPWLNTAKVSRLAEDEIVLERAAPHRDLPAGTDPQELSQAGWGLILAEGEEERGVYEKLQKLIDHRKDLAKGRFKEWTLRPNVHPLKLLYDKLKTSPGTIDPKQTPYFLLLVGSPEQISFETQYALSVNHAVGRLYFENLEDYSRYAQAVVDAEESVGGVGRPRRVDLFAVEKPGDEAARQLAEYMVGPVAKSLPDRVDNWSLDVTRGQDGDRERLLRLLSGGEATPSLLLAACHGKEKAFASKDQFDEQGALECLDGALTAELLEEALKATTEERPLHGLIAFFAACYGAGTPLIDNFPHEDQHSKVVETELEPLAEQNFVARLPQTLLTHGTLAVIGHVDRGWTSSFRWIYRGEGSEAARSFEDSMVRLLQGHRLGHALRPLFRRASAVGAQLLPMLEAVRNQLKVHLGDLRSHWTAYADARGYIVLGDPAVRLPNQDPPEFVRDPTSVLDLAQPIYLDAETVAKARKKAEEAGLDLNAWLQDKVETLLETGSLGFGSGRSGPVYRDFGRGGG